MIQENAAGIKSLPSDYSVDESVERLKGILRSRNITLFALVDHSGEAAKAGLNMLPTRLLIFGNPRGGTPLMLAAPSSALDLPLKILVAEDETGRVSLSWNDPAYLQRRHGFPPELIANIAVVEALALSAMQ
jgi:uncharacterized protein (DUF302 family)